MAIRIVDGKPGSGKSYYVVNHLAKNYFTEDRGLYVLKDGYCIITNIDSFKPQHIDLKEIASEHGGYDSFFTAEVQEQLKNKHGRIIYIIDEAQRIFRKNYKNEDVFFWFETHRHLGQDIYLITQHYKKLPFDVYSLAEFIIYAAPRTRSLAGEFRYHWMDDGTKIKTETLRRKQQIFALYKSMDMKESEKIGNPVMKSALLALAGFVVILVIASRFMFGGIIWKGGTGATKEAHASVPETNYSAPPPTTAQGRPEPDITYAWKALNVIRTFDQWGNVGEMVVINDSLIPLYLCPFEIRRAGRSIYAYMPLEENRGARRQSEEGSGSSGLTNDDLGAGDLPPSPS